MVRLGRRISYASIVPTRLDSLAGLRNAVNAAQARFDLTSRQCVFKVLAALPVKPNLPLGYPSMKSN